MKILIKTFDSIIQIISNLEIISSNTVIDKLSAIENIDKNSIILLHDQIIIKYFINEIYLTETTIFFMIIKPYFLS